MTQFDTVIDQALIVVDDYKIVKAYNQGEETFQTYCDGFLVSAIPNFTECRTDLSYDLENRTFTNDLTNLEISILADLWVMEWMRKEVQNAAQIQLKLKNSGSFTFNSEAQNLKEKSTYLDKLREKVAQKITDYLLMNLDTTSY